MLESISCKNCRFSLIQPSRIPLVVLRGSDSHWALNPDFDYASEASTAWIQEAISKSEWTKGKLKCDCGCRLGSFDFVSGFEDPIRVQKAKVDAKSTEVSKNLLEIRGVQIDSSDERSEYDSSSSSAPEGDSLNRFHEGSKCQSTKSSLKRKKFRKKKKHKTSSNSISSSVIKEEDDESGSEESRKTRLLKRTIENVSDLDNVNEDLICPICLDLFFLPHKVVPCGHVFCETCLRRLAWEDPMYSLCPMCRIQICNCELQEELSAKVKDDHPDMHSRRKDMESKSEVFEYSLPWKPSWKSLITGRGQNESEGFLQRIDAQLPYLFPDVAVMDLFMLIFIAETVSASLVWIVFPLIRCILSEGPTTPMATTDSSEESETFSLSFIPSSTIDEYIFNAITHLLTFFGFALMVVYHSMTDGTSRRSSFHQMLNQLDNIVENNFRRISPIMIGVFGYRLAYGLYMAFWKSS